MDCHVCGKGAGAACYYCDRAVCRTHVAQEKRLWVCRNPDEVCSKVRGKKAVEATRSEFGTCPYPDCNLDLVLIKESGELKCPADGYVGISARRPSKIHQ